MTRPDLRDLDYIIGKALSMEIIKKQLSLIEKGASTPFAAQFSTIRAAIILVVAYRKEGATKLELRDALVKAITGEFDAYFDSADMESLRDQLIKRAKP